MWKKQCENNNEATWEEQHNNVKRISNNTNNVPTWGKLNTNARKGTTTQCNEKQQHMVRVAPTWEKHIEHQQGNGSTNDMSKTNTSGNTNGTTTAMQVGMPMQKENTKREKQPRE